MAIGQFYEQETEKRKFWQIQFLGKYSYYQQLYFTDIQFDRIKFKILLSKILLKCFPYYSLRSELKSKL